MLARCGREQVRCFAILKGEVAAGMIWKHCLWGGPRVIEAIGVWTGEGCWIGFEAGCC